MARVKPSVQTRKRHKKILKLAKGFRMARSRRFKAAQEAVLHSGDYAYIGRKLKKRDFRKLWITRMNAALKQHGTSYSKFINQLKKKDIALDRKVLAFFAAEKPGIFKKIVDKVN